MAYLFHIVAKFFQKLCVDFTGTLKHVTFIVHHIVVAKQLIELFTLKTLHWRNNERDGVLNHQRHDCLLNCLFRRRSKKRSKLRVTCLCAGNSPVAGEFPVQKASNAEKMFPFDDVIMNSNVLHACRPTLQRIVLHGYHASINFTIVKL